ncbi:MAG: response regulator transcription factor, partial [Spirochaetota bacterium]
VELELLGLNYTDFFKLLLKENPNYKIAILTNITEGKVIRKCIRAGAMGYILKSEIYTLPEAIGIIQKGGCILSPTATFQILNAINRIQEKAPKLTLRETQVLERLEEGLSIPEISKSLFISVDTARFHVKNIYKKFHVNNRLNLLKKVGNLNYH